MVEPSFNKHFYNGHGHTYLKIYLTDYIFFDSKEKMETICFQPLEKLRIVISCNHSICLSCFIHLNKRECPLCRYEFEKDLPLIKEQQTKHNLTQYLNSQKLTAE